MKKRRGKTLRGFAATPDRRGVIKQAASDLQRGLQDTDCRAFRRPRPSRSGGR
jgi:hypothetical protein